MSARLARTVEAVYLTQVGIHAALAAVVIAGGASRFATMSHVTLLDVAHGETWPYGLVFAAAALLMVCPGHPVKVVGTFLGMVGMYLMGSLFLVAAVTFDHASSTAPVMYFGGGALNTVLLGSMIVYWRRET